MPKIEQTLTSIEVANMVEKEHKFLMRDIRRYLNQISEGNEKYGGGCKIAPSDFFAESTYRSEQNKELPCYRITKKGCEFIAHKLTGTKGTIFTARYINRFHEMQDILAKKPGGPEPPWFIRRFQGRYIMLFRDFKTLTGVEICGNYTAWERPDRLRGGRDCNGWAWYTRVNKEEFLKENGFDYGDDKCMMYLYPCGIRKALEIYRRESGRKINQEAYDLISGGLEAIQPQRKGIADKEQEHAVPGRECRNQIPVQINIIVGEGGGRIRY